MPESIGDAVALSCLSTHTAGTCTTETCEDAFICEMIFPALRNYPSTRSFPTRTSGWSGAGDPYFVPPIALAERARQRARRSLHPPTTLMDGNLALGGGVRSCSARPAWCSQQQRRACDKGQVCLSSRLCLTRTKDKGLKVTMDCYVSLTTRGLPQLSPMLVSGGNFAGPSTADRLHISVR